jgi:hypothetical protein
MSLVEKGQASIGAIRSVELDNADLKFIPKALAEKCRQLIESCHAIPHYPSLPDMLWHGLTRDFIECDRTLLKIFKKASISRSAKKANQAFTLIATVVLALEILARDYAGWGTRFPSAKRKADALISEFRPSSQSWLIDVYLFPRGRSGPSMASAIAPTDEPDLHHLAGAPNRLLRPA